MAGRYPFDASGGRGQAQLNAAQIRAALGLPQVDETSYLHAHQRHQQDLHRDIQLRQLLLQEQIEQQVQEQQLRSIGDQLQDFPDLQQHYQSLLITEQINRRREQVAEAQRRYQEELRARQQLGLLSDEASLSSLGPAQPASPPLAAARMPAAALRALETRLSLGQNMERQAMPVAYSFEDEIAKATPKRTASVDSADLDRKPRAKRLKRPDRMTSPSSSEATSSVVAEGASQTKDADGVAIEDSLQKFVLAADMMDLKLERKGTIEGLLTAADEHEKIEDAADVVRKLEHVEWSDSEDEKSVEEPEYQIEFSSDPNESISSPRFESALPRLPVESLLDEDTAGEEKKKTAPEKEEQKTDDGVTKEGEVEPGKPSTGVPMNGQQKGKKKISALLDYPVPIDTWWPSLTGMRRERRNAGETSDEDLFEDVPTLTGESLLFRANEHKIRNRLARHIEPGVLEKLPHCRLHRVRTKRKKNSTAPEFVYCWQVTEIYPNDTIVCCSRCGTWRHAACGGHYKSYSTRDNTKAPFAAICENCHEEEKFLEDFPLGAKRMDRQRIEHIRRALSTSAVMRQASFSKHGGTYKWPLGSVSATHIAGHTRSVHARHDKAEKQWSDMGLRLSRGFGYRPKERVKSRTKELERLMVSVEDAEAFTERHNMLHFLMRDTAREKPVGYDRELSNIFDLEVPSRPEKMKANVEKEDAKMEGDDDESESVASAPCCARKGCREKPRFDSLFCSDACGVSALESDLLQTIFEASEIHPSVLRL